MGGAERGGGEQVSGEMIPEPVANRIYDVLVRYAGAIESDRLGFVLAHSSAHSEPGGCREWRFQGSLGFGGKFRNDNNRWRVDCYPEDLTQARNLIIAATNAALAELRREAGAR